LGAARRAAPVRLEGAGGFLPQDAGYLSDMSTRIASMLRRLRPFRTDARERVLRYVN
jgi:hypothetical protein